jgi:O-antigen/teichoic acid export membrane protein
MRLLRNAASILASDVVNRGSTFLLYILVGRHLGRGDFGRLSLALALFYVFQVLAGAGLKVSITRRIAKDEATTGECLVLGSAVAATFALLSIAATFVFVEVMAYPADTARVILLLNAALLPFALSAVCEGVFQGRERMHHIAQATLPANVLKVAVVFVLLTTGHGLEAVVGVVLAAYVAVLLVEWSLILRHITRPRLAFSTSRAIAIGREASTFLGVDALVAVMASTNVVLLSKLSDERAVGLYSSAAQLMVPVALVYQNAVLAAFPLMSRRIDSSLDDVRAIAERVGEILMTIGWFVAVALVVLAAPVLAALYGPEFRPAADALRVMAWALLLTGLTATFGQLLYAGRRERVNLRLVAINAGLSIVIAIPLVAALGLMGAALAVLTTRIFDFVLHYVAVSRLLPRVQVPAMVVKPAIASACTAPVLIVLGPERPLIATGLAGIVYTAVIGLLAVRSAGGFRGVKGRYLDVSVD